MNAPDCLPLPRGPYPTAVWPAHITHLPAAPVDELAAAIRRQDYTPAQLALLVSVLANKAATMKLCGKACWYLDSAADALESLS